MIGYFYSTKYNRTLSSFTASKPISIKFSPVFASIDGFAKVITIANAAQNAYSLSIPLYVRELVDVEATDSRTVRECASAWQEAAFDMRTAYDDLKALMVSDHNITYAAPDERELPMVAETTEGMADCE